MVKRAEILERNNIMNKMIILFVCKSKNIPEIRKSKNREMINIKKKTSNNGLNLSTGSSPVAG